MDDAEAERQLAALVYDQQQKERNDHTSRTGLSISDITPEDASLIKQRGYILRREIGDGEGSTRHAYRTDRQVGNLEIEVALKVPKQEEEITSFNALLNRSKKNLDLQEAIISGKLRHPGIARIVDSFQLSDGRTVNAEDFIDGWSLRRFIQRANPIKEPAKLKQTFAPVVSALSYAHRLGILHRDITPLNILVTDSAGSPAVITDWQNAAYRKDIDSLSLPTRGGTQFTHPILLNALVTDTPASASSRTDIYSLGATLYEAITGDKAFDYGIAPSETGRVVMIGGKEFKVGLQSGGQNLDRISFEDHERNLRKALNKVPRQFRGLIRRALTTDESKAFSSMSEFEAEFGKATRPGLEEKLDKAVRYAKAAGLGAVIGFAGVLGAYSGLIMESQPKQDSPRISELLNTQAQLAHYARVNTSGAPIPYNIIDFEKPNAGFNKYVAEAKKNKDSLANGPVGQLADTVREDMFDKRLALSLARSVYLEGTNGMTGVSGRLETLVPKNYLLARRSPRATEDKELTDAKSWRSWMTLGQYTQGRYLPGDSIESTYARTVCSEEEIARAVARAEQLYLCNKARESSLTGESFSRCGDWMSLIGSDKNTLSPSYFARQEPAADGKTRIIPGYADFLDPKKRSIIDRAIVFYVMTDNKGNLNPDLYNQSVGSTGLTSRQTSGEAAK